jgi:hypothetical protein
VEIKKGIIENYFVFWESEGEIFIKRRDFLRGFISRVFASIVCAPLIFRFFNVEIPAILKGILVKTDQENCASSYQIICAGDKIKQRRCFYIIPREARHYEVLSGWGGLNALRNFFSSLTNDKSRRLLE